MSETDVLIIGAGPAGLMLAACLSKQNIDYRIIDKAEDRILVGHADGFQCRTMEVFQSLGIAEEAKKLGTEVAEVVFYNPDESGKGLVETDRILDTDPGVSVFRHVLLGQGDVEKILIDMMHKDNGNVVERLTTPVALERDSSSSATHPISVKVQRVKAKARTNGVSSGLYRSNLFEAVEDQTESQTEETIKCKYLVGCDGARSWTRKQVGVELKGDANNSYWGVIDARPVTNLPTIRLKNTVHSAENGSILTVPRERGYVRFYIQMGELEPGKRVDRNEITLERIVSKAKSIMAPFSLEVPEVEWYTIYEIGQRLSETFSVDQRIFLAGDACHTHSPKAGQGMNTSMNDTWNLAWKLASVLKGQAKPELLDTYETERYKIAKELIDFDYKFSRLFSGKPGAAESGGVPPEVFNQAFKAARLWATGTAVTYKDSPIVFTEASASVKSYPNLASKITIGTRLQTRQVVNTANSQAIQLQHCIVADGRWRVLLFPGDINVPSAKARLEKVCPKLEATIQKYTSKTSDIDSNVSILTVFAQHYRSVPYQLPRILKPLRGQYQYEAFDTCFADCESIHDGNGRAHEGYGIVPSQGCMIVVRPDQYVSAVLALEDMDSLDALLGGVFRTQS